MQKDKHSLRREDSSLNFLTEGVCLYLFDYDKKSTQTEYVAVCLLSLLLKNATLTGGFVFQKTVNGEINKRVQQKCFKSCNILNNRSSISSPSSGVIGREN